jgi:hypothetical protein
MTRFPLPDGIPREANRYDPLLQAACIIRAIEGRHNASFEKQGEGYGIDGYCKFG